MKRKLVLTGITCLVIICFCIAFAMGDFSSGQKIYVKSSVENLRDSPKGNKIGSLNRGVSMTVLEDSPQWVKVRVEAWIWKDSVTDNSLIASTGGTYRALQIIVKELTDAENVLQRLKAGEDFKVIAQEISIGPAAKRGGDIGYFNKGDFQPEVETAILNIQPGEISGIVKSNIGFHIFKRVQ